MFNTVAVECTKITQAVAETLITSPNRCRYPITSAPTTINTTWENDLVERRNVVMNCLVGNKRKWKRSEKLKVRSETLELNALVADQSQPFHVTLSWNDDSKTFADVLNLFGHVPLPPYIK